ncbi:MAG: HEAT repeat domain-containing protein, partial [Chloroflexota bacterium]
MANEVSPKYEKYAEGYTKRLRAKDPNLRAKAARMVGEYGVADAIPQLVDMAQNDPDPTVRENASYALGMFAAFRDAIHSTNPDDGEEAVAAISRMVATGETGKMAEEGESSGSSGGGGPLLIGLSVLLAVLIAANAAVFFLLGDSAAPGPGGE